MDPIPRLDILGAALADPTRARVICVLMDGRAFTAKELASDAAVTPQTMSGHLKHLKEAGLITALKSGRCIYHRIANPRMAEMIEALSTFTPEDTVFRPEGHRRLPRAICTARSCYNHIAGSLGVAMFDTLEREGHIVVDGLLVTGTDSLRDVPRLGPMLAGAGPGKACLDWTERRPHLAGAMGRALMETLLDEAWLRRTARPRVLEVTRKGQAGLKDSFGLTVPAG